MTDPCLFGILCIPVIHVAIVPTLGGLQNSVAALTVSFFPPIGQIPYQRALKVANPGSSIIMIVSSFAGTIDSPDLVVRKSDRSL